MAYRKVALDMRDVIRRYKTGVSVLQLSADLGVHRETLTARLRKLGVLRTQSEQEVAKWAMMTPLQRQHQVAHAHAAMRGTTRSEQELARRQQARAGNVRFASPAERFLAQLLQERGEAVAIQVPVGRYLCDLTLGPVAVEVFGGLFHFYGRHAQRARHRYEYLRDQGWHLYIVVVAGKAHPLLPATADDLIAFAQRTRRLPPSRREYRVVWGDGKLLASGSLHRDYEALVETLRRSPHRRVPHTGIS